MDWVEILFDGIVAAVGPVAAAYALSAIGLNLQFGYTGLLNFGHVAFMMVGAYGTAVTVDLGGSLWLGIAVGVLAGIFLGLLLGIPTLRLRADYLAIVTISVGEILRLLARSSFAEPLTGGVFGIQAFADAFFDLNPFSPGARYGWGEFTFQGRQLFVLLVGWALVGIGVLMVWKLIRSPWGRVIRAIREDEDAVRSLGKNVFFYKLQSLMLGGAFGAVAGALLAIEQQNVTPNSFEPKITFFLYVIVIIGGAGTIIGPVFGAVIFQFLFFFFDSFMSSAQQAGWFGEVLDATDAAQVKLVLVGVGLMTLMAFRPQGIFGNKEEMLVGDT
jgi:branched-chain amino acid transport system permease protein